MSPRIPVAVLLAIALGGPSWSFAGTTITAHQMSSVTLKTVTQITTSKSDTKPSTNSVNAKELFNLCVGAKPAKNEALFIFFDCAGPPPGTAQIKAINTQPLTDLKDVGTIEFGTPLVRTTKGGGTTTTTIKAPATVHIDCGAAATADLSGTINLKYTAFPNSGPVCPSNGSMKVTGTAVSLGTDFVIDDGSILKFNTRDGGITVIPPSP